MITQRFVKRFQRFPILNGKWSTPGASSQSFKVGEGLHLGNFQQLTLMLQPAPNPVEESVNQHELVVVRVGRFQVVLDQFDTHSVHVDPFEFIKQLVFDESGIFRSQKVESLVMQNVPFRAFEPNESTNQCLDALRHKIQFFPQNVQLNTFFIRQHLLNQWLVVTKESFDEMKAGRQTTTLVDVEEPIGKRVAEFLSGLKITAHKTAAGIDQQLCLVRILIARRAIRRRLNQHS